jgi:hypothetical protein
MIEARDCHTATPLPDGRILMVGGQDGIDEVPIGSTELFDPETTAFRPSGRLKTDRVHHSATALPDGRVLIAGGRDSTTCLSMVEIYDPGSGFLRVAAYMMSPRQEHTATLLFDGRVLLVGGLGGTPSPADAEVCVP